MPIDFEKEEFPRNAVPGEIFSWGAVSRIHKIQRGIYQTGGRLVSLLTDFGKINPCYPDAPGEEAGTIFYTGAGRRGDQPLDAFNRAMLAAIETEHSVPLFNKLSVGHWQFMGFWRVAASEYVFDAARERMVWRFTLKAAGGE